MGSSFPVSLPHTPTRKWKILETAPLTALGRSAIIQLSSYSRRTPRGSPPPRPLPPSEKHRMPTTPSLPGSQSGISPRRVGPPTLPNSSRVHALLIPGTSFLSLYSGNQTVFIVRVSGGNGNSHIPLGRYHSGPFLSMGGRTHLTVFEVPFSCSPG